MRKIPKAPVFVLLCVFLLSCLPAFGPSATKPVAAAASVDESLGGMHLYRGNLHSHTSYSVTDGEGTPAGALAWARDTAGFDFYAITDHAEFLNPLTWWDTGCQVNRFNRDGDFVAIRGFEWSNPYYGHSCVWNTPAYTNAILNPAPDLFYSWLVLNNGLAEFNHPGREAGVFDQMAYKESGVKQFCAMEVGNKEVGVNDAEYFNWYIQALDKGWILAPTENQDNHTTATNSHRTVVVAPSLTRDNVLDALRQRRVYSSDDPNMDVVFKCNNAWLGSTIQAGAGDTLTFEVAVEDDENISKLELVSNGGEVVAEKSFNPASNSRKVHWEPSFSVTEHAAGTSYFLLRVTEQDTNGEDDLGKGYQMAVTAPVWVDVQPGAQLNAYSGDLHSHSTYSDGDLSVADVLGRAEAKGLDFFALTDHGTTAQWNDPGFVSDTMTLLYGVEWTTGNGHACIWSNLPYDWENVIKPTLGDASAAIAATHSFNVEDQVALFSINHPYCPGNEWNYTFEESKDADCMEVWNARYLWPNLNPPSFTTTMDEYIKGGKLISIVGGSDSHVHESPLSDPANWVQTLYHDVGIPTTWVYAESQSAADIIEALREGHGSISVTSAGPQLKFMADVDYRPNEPQTFEVLMGDSIPANAIGQEVRFRAEVTYPAALTPTLVVVKKNAQLITWTINYDTDFTFDFPDIPQQGDYYTVELRQITLDEAAQPTMLISQLSQVGWVSALSNPIFVMPEAEPGFVQL